MSLAHGFRLSFYMSLALACLCLFFGEWDFLPWACALFPVILSLMYVAYRQEGLCHLSADAANLLGTLIGLGTFIWVISKVPRGGEDLTMGGVPWPASLLPLLAPLLPVLLLVKLYRPKTLADFWVFQAISLVIVTLSCILAAEIWFFLLLCLYLASLLWCMTLYFLYRQKVIAAQPAVQLSRVSLFADRQPDDSVGAAGADEGRVPWPYLGASRVWRWTAAILSLGLVLFLLTPRFSELQWVPTTLSNNARTSLKSGVEAGIDLTREGVLELSSEPAFEVVALDKQGRICPLPGEQRWRFQTLDHYHRGHWTSWQQTPNYRRRPSRALPHGDHVYEDPRLPDKPPFELAHDQVYVHYKVRVQSAGGLGLAEPIVPEMSGFFPYVNDAAWKGVIFRWVPQSDTVLTKIPSRRHLVQYGQILTPVAQAEEQPAVEVSRDYIDYILQQVVPPFLEGWTRDALLDSVDVDDADLVKDEANHFMPEKHARIARALCKHLAQSPTFSYSLKLRRVNYALDPIEDFLLNVKEGHCERYAAALTLMLRSVQIPARVVKGYLGGEYVEGSGHVIRQSQAHSWVQALVPGEKAGEWKWLMVDPTPSGLESGRGFQSFLDSLWTHLRNPGFLWKNMIMEYNPEKQSSAAQELWSKVTINRRQRLFFADFWQSYGWTAPVLCLAAASFFGWRHWRRWGVRQSSVPALGFYGRLLKVLAQHCQLRPQRGQTPLEFAFLSRAALLGRSVEISLAQLPLRAVDLLYRIRFGGRSVPAAECRDLENGIKELEASLRRPAAPAVAG